MPSSKPAFLAVAPTSRWLSRGRLALGVTIAPSFSRQGEDRVSRLA
jgi:hypothetical protein